MIKPGNSSDRKAPVRRRSWLWLLLVLLIPAFGVIAWLEPDEQDLFELCSTQGKPVIYRSVEAEGYFYGSATDCWGCWNYLENTDYKFIEFTISDQKVWGPIQEPGIYRATRIPAGSPQCDAKLTSFYTKTQRRREEFERNNWCFQLERLDGREARYGYYYEGLGAVSRSPVTGSSITAARSFFLDHERGEILAETTDYGLAKYPFFQVSSFRSRGVCNDFADKLGFRSFNRQEVIKPGREISP